jgi:hypothetical protein
MRAHAAEVVTEVCAHSKTSRRIATTEGHALPIRTETGVCGDSPGIRP